MGVVGWEPERELGMSSEIGPTPMRKGFMQIIKRCGGIKAKKGWGVIRARREGAEVHQGVKRIRADAKRGQDGGHTDLLIWP